jgi:hypothetical protein
MSKSVQYDAVLRTFRTFQTKDDHSTSQWSDTIDVNDLCRGQNQHTVDSVVDAVGDMLRDMPYWFTARVLREVMRDPNVG